MSHTTNASSVIGNSESVSTPDFGDKLAITAGLSYATGFTLGMLKGAFRIITKPVKLPRRLRFNNAVNTLGVETSKVGNAFGAAGVLYFLVAGGLNVFF